MPPRNPFGWSLPPGVTDRMIDEAAGSDIKWLWFCSSCGQENTDQDAYCTQCHKLLDDEEDEKEDQQ